MHAIENKVPANTTGDDPIRICFFFNAQRHQLLHGISIAVALARKPGFEVHVLSPSPEHIEYAQEVVVQLGGAPIIFSAVTPALADAVRKSTGASVPPKLLSLGLLARHLNTFDAIALPERTSTILKRLGAPSPCYIHLDHGAGDRAAGFDPRIERFDMVLMAGEKHRARLLRDGLIKDGRYAVVGYPKFEAADAIRASDWSPFCDAKPIVLYNPHFSELGSWDKFGLPLLREFAAQDRYNLIVAPHVRMLDSKKKRARWAAIVNEFSRLPHILLDPGSDRSIDMAYTTLADVYVGDVSSQVYEFLRVPKPCVFLDAHGIEWETDENYAHWKFGPVVRSTDNLIAAIDAGRASHSHFIPAQEEGFDLTFKRSERSASDRAATAIADYLNTVRTRHRRAVGVRSTPTAWQRLQRAAAVMLAISTGWIAHDTIGPLSAPAHATGFVDEAIASYHTSLIRAEMHSQPEVVECNATEIELATGIRMPQMPAKWRLTDVQVYPSDMGPMVQLAIRTERNEMVSFVATRANTPAGSTPLLSRRQGEHVVFWEDRDQAYGIVGNIDAQRLLTLASDVINASRPSKDKIVQTL